MARTRTSNVWATQAAFEGNVVKQLLVPTAELDLIAQPDGTVAVASAFGEWPAAVSPQALGDGIFGLQLPLGATPAGSFKPGKWVAGKWVGPLAAWSTDAIRSTWHGAFVFRNIVPLREADRG